MSAVDDQSRAAVLTQLTGDLPYTKDAELKRSLESIEEKDRQIAKKQKDINNVSFATAISSPL